MSIVLKSVVVIRDKDELTFYHFLTNGLMHAFLPNYLRSDQFCYDAATTWLCVHTRRTRPDTGEDDVWIYKVLGVKPHVLRLSRPRLLLCSIR